MYHSLSTSETSVCVSSIQCVMDSSKSDPRYLGESRCLVLVLSYSGALPYRHTIVNGTLSMVRISMVLVAEGMPSWRARHTRVNSISRALESTNATARKCWIDTAVLVNFVSPW